MTWAATNKALNKQKKLANILLTFFLKYLNLEAVDQKCSVKQVFLEISQNYQENTFAKVSFLIKLQVWALQLY